MSLPRPARFGSSATIWSLCAGGYALLCSLSILFLTVWSPQLVVAGGILVVFVLAVVVPTGALAALPLTYVRRRMEAVPPA